MWEYNFYFNNPNINFFIYPTNGSISVSMNKLLFMLDPDWFAVTDYCVWTEIKLNHSIKDNRVYILSTLYKWQALLISIIFFEIKSQ